MIRAGFNKITRALLARTEKPEALQNTRRQFLPAALEVEESPANPASRAIVKTIILLFTIAIFWACFGKIDIVATAQGKIVPGERVKTIQPMVIGEVENIHVREGEEVKAGDPLITFVGTVTEAELVRLTREITALEIQLAREEAFTKYLDDHNSNHAPHSTPSTLTRIKNLNLWLANALPAESSLFEKQLLQQQIADYIAASETLKSQLKSKAAEQQTIKANVTKLQRLLPIIEERTDAVEGLYKKNYGSKVQYLELEQQRIELEEDIKAQKATVQQLVAEQEEVQNQLLSLHARNRRESLDQQEQLRRQLTGLKQERIKAVELHDQQQIVSPIDGTVQQLQIHTIGGVVQPAQALMQVVPKKAKLEVEA